MRISVVTAVLNRVATVGTALDSVAAQDHPDVEHVVQDGGSADGTLELLARRAELQQSPPIALTSERDGGIYDALNRGITRSAGEVVGLRTARP